MNNEQKFYINGQWVDPISSETTEVIDPATEKPLANVALGSEADVDRAVSAARDAFPSFSATPVETRVAMMRRILEVFERRAEEMAEVISAEMGSPAFLATGAHVPMGTGHISAAIDALEGYELEEQLGSTTVVYEPIGVCAFITPWNWPLNQISAKVAPALAAGCTIVLKPSEIAPLNAILYAEILDEAGVPAGVFNLVNGTGPVVGAALSKHPEVDMVSFTGSTRAGIEVAKNAAPTVKRIAQELGGKSANIILDDVDLEEVIARDIGGMFVNSGQSCNAGSRMLVPNSMMDTVVAIAADTADSVVVGAPGDEGTAVGPVVSAAQFDKIQHLISVGIDEGATVVAGGLGRPEGVEEGYYVRPTVFTDVTNDMTIAREEIFGPVIVIIGYEDDEDAIRIANDSPYGLSGFVSSADRERAGAVARRIRTGMVHVNGAGLDLNAPFGGYKQSGNGREFGRHGLQEFLEAKSIFGDND